MIQWIKSDMRGMNGLVQSVVQGNFEFGIFSEKYGGRSCKWSLRKRPVDKNGHALDSWGHVLLPSETKKKVVQFAETYIPKIVRNCQTCDHNDANIAKDNGACVMGHGVCSPNRYDCIDYMPIEESP